jgi:hypothetical protein
VIQVCLSMRYLKSILLFSKASVDVEVSPEVAAFQHAASELLAYLEKVERERGSDLGEVSAYLRTPEGEAWVRTELALLESSRPDARTILARQD